MLKTRIIPCLDVIKNKVVKGVNFKNIKVMGNAVDMAMLLIWQSFIRKLVQTNYVC